MRSLQRAKDGREEGAHWANRALVVSWTKCHALPWASPKPLGVSQALQNFFVIGLFIIGLERRSDPP